MKQPFITTSFKTAQISLYTTDSVDKFIHSFRVLVCLRRHRQPTAFNAVDTFSCIVLSHFFLFISQTNEKRCQERCSSPYHFRCLYISLRFSKWWTSLQSTVSSFWSRAIGRSLRGAGEGIKTALTLWEISKVFSREQALWVILFLRPAGTNGLVEN